MRKAIPFPAVLACLAACVVSAAFAQSPTKQTYKWVDEKGVTHYGDSVPAEYSQREQRVLDSRGIEVQKRTAEMNPKEAAEYGARQKEESERRAHDVFLVSTYPSVKEIENVRDTRLDLIKGQISAAEAYISGLTSRIDNLKQRSLMFAPYNTKAGARRMPDDLVEEMVRALSELRTQNSALDGRKSEYANVSNSFNNDIKRFKELRMSAAARLNDATHPRKK